MNAIRREELLTSLEQVVEQQLQITIRQFQNLDEHLLLQPAPNGGWSIAQCLAHLTSYGDYYLPRIKQAVTTQPGRPVGYFVNGTWLGRYCIQLMDSTVSSRKFRAARQHQPAAELRGSAVVAGFIQQQEELLAYLGQARQVDLDAVRIPISIAPRLIRLTLGDLLQFLSVHNERHLQQAQRLLPQRH